MVCGQGQFGRLEAVGSEIEGSKGKRHCQGIRRGRGSRTLVAAGTCRRDVSRSDACLSILEGLTAQLQSVCEGFFMCPDKLC